MWVVPGWLLADPGFKLPPGIQCIGENEKAGLQNLPKPGKWVRADAVMLPSLGLVKARCSGASCLSRVTRRRMRTPSKLPTGGTGRPCSFRSMAGTRFASASATFQAMPRWVAPSTRARCPSRTEERSTRTAQGSNSGLKVIMLLPRVTIWRFVAATVGLGACLGLTCRFFDTRTFYSQGYSETKFRSVREGMTAEQVEAVMGPPLEKIPWQDGAVNWTYSDRPWDTADFSRRWIIFRGGKVDSVINDYWTE